MAYVLTNKTAQTPLGFGALGVAIEPGQSLTITREQAALLQEHPVIAGWVAEGKLKVTGTAEEWLPDPDAQRKLEEAEAEELRKKQEAEKLAAEAALVPPVPEVVPPKVPTPTPTGKK